MTITNFKGLLDRECASSNVLHTLKTLLIQCREEATQLMGEKWDPSIKYSDKLVLWVVSDGNIAVL